MISFAVNSSNKVRFTNKEAHSFCKEIKDRTGLEVSFNFYKGTDNGALCDTYTFIVNKVPRVEIRTTKDGFLDGKFLELDAVKVFDILRMNGPEGRMDCNTNWYSSTSVAIDDLVDRINNPKQKCCCYGHFTMM